MNEEDGASAAPTGDGLLSRLELIEQRPLAERADAYVQVHDELSAVLDASERERASR
ncbi:hypothetical protein SAMN04489806_2644 [Paramicrobacterium humi]|uniref:Uncharacterized protein n=1 Tax=Paramicrobacterium humi TaxID=640635 RepID=A0A1H4PX57_9MICO|nr:hypothetical protein [Microbacterium humi]SEC12017.1 hypothetical protein SAMN04489806_2644 [Microbacterium humi]